MNIDLALANKKQRFDEIIRISQNTHIMSSVSQVWMIQEMFFYPNVVLKNKPTFPTQTKHLAKVRLYKNNNSINEKRDTFNQSYVYSQKEGTNLFLQKPLRQTIKKTGVFNNGVSCTPLQALQILKTMYNNIFSTGSVYDSEKEEMILLMDIEMCDNEINSFTSFYLIEDNMCCIDAHNEIRVYKRYFIDSKQYTNNDVKYVDQYPNQLNFVNVYVYTGGNNWLIFPSLISNNTDQIMTKNNHVYRTVKKDSLDILEDMLDDTETYPSNFQIDESACMKFGVGGDVFEGKRTFLIVKNTFQCGGVYMDQSSFSFVTYYSLIDVSADYYLAIDYWSKYSKDLSGSIRKYYNADGTITVSGGLYKQQPIKQLFKTTKENAQLYMRNMGYNTSETCLSITLEIADIDTSGYYQRYVIYPIQGKGNGVMAFDGYLIANGTADDYLQVTVNGNVVYSDSNYSVVTYNNKTLCSFKKGDVVRIYLADNMGGVCYFRGSIILKPIVNQGGMYE